MKNILSAAHPLSRYILIFGGVAVMLTVSASALTYLGSGILWDYYQGMYFADKLLECTRPLSVAVSAASLCVEYRAKRAN